MAQQKHTWTDCELWIVCVCYKEGIPVDVALRLTNTTNRKSMEMRYANCLFLEKGRVDGSLSHASKLHQRIWNEVQELYDNQPEEEKEEVVIVKENVDGYKSCEVIMILFAVFYITILSLSLKWI